MQGSRTVKSSIQLAAVSAAALAAFTSTASAGGFSIGEQSTVFMGSASAGAAAGGNISSMYWNPAATAALPGPHTESSYTLILPDGQVTVTGINGANNVPAGTPGSTSGNVGIDATTSASYGTYQVSNDIWIGMSLDSPFGLATKPEDPGYLGSVLGVTTKLITMEATPSIAYKIAPGITVGAGVRIMWSQAKLQFDEAPLTPPGGSIAQFQGTDWAVGGSVGITLEPVRGTTIGIGYRSAMKLDVDGTLNQPGIFTPAPVVLPGQYPGVGSINLPDMVTASFRHELTPDLRLLGTVEWTNWSRFKDLTLTSAGAGPTGEVEVPANWSDDWFFSLGGEYDYSPIVTLRGGVAYEISPEDAPEKRFTTIPDNDRVWVNVGASYKWSDSLTIDVAYSHIFVKDGDFERTGVVVPETVTGSIDASADLISVGMRTTW